MAYPLKIAAAILMAMAFVFSTQTVQETSSMSESRNPDWWVNSGAYFKIADGIGQTNYGDLSANDKWRILYSYTNPLDTDNGFHPQNIFRLVSRNSIKDPVQQAFFRIDEYRLSGSPNRDGHNGLLLMSRYKDENNIYYAGLRVDGNAVIKKKLNGRYQTLALVKVLPGLYNRDLQPNLIPLRKWVGIKSIITDDADGSVRIRLYINMESSWNLVAEALDGKEDKIAGPGYTGIRTDFMDASFKNYSVSSSK